MNELNSSSRVKGIPKRAVRFALRMMYYSYRSQDRINLQSVCALFKLLRLYINDGFTPEEAFQYGFLSNRFAFGSQEQYTSRKRMSAIQRKINPASWAPLTEDKSIFYKFCEKTNIPTPKLYAIIFKSSPGWSYVDSKINNKNDWNEFSTKSLPNEFVIKPARGVYGQGIKIYQRGDKIFIDENKVPAGPGLIYDHMMNDHDYDCFIIQERLRNHSDLSKLSKSDYLQTIRVITNVDKKWNCCIICAYLKPIVGSNIVDNQNYGRTGNLLARIDLEKGVLQSAIYLASNPEGIQTLMSHPDTGTCFSNFLIPHWKDVCDLAISTAYKFIPIQSIGWDIAVTPKGPYIIEGNTWWDPPKFGDMHKLISQLST